MALSPSSLWKGDAGAYVKKSSLSLTVLSLCAEARGLLSQTYQPENLGLDYAPGLWPVHMREQPDRPKHHETR
jgi:hypothetical protein